MFSKSTSAVAATQSSTATAEPGHTSGYAAGRSRRVTAVRRLWCARRRVLRPLVGVTAVVSAWWLAVRAFDLQPFFLPAPPDIAEALTGHHAYLAGEAAATLGHTLGGFAAAATAGVMTALLLAVSPWARETILPMVIALQTVPKVAIAPLLVVWFGFGPATKVILVALLCFFPILVSTLSGLRSTPTELVELARSLTASRTQSLAKIRIWWALPQMFTGLKVAVSLALIGAVVAEIITPNSGLGAVILRCGQAANTPLAFAAITMLAAIGISLYYLLLGLERLVVPWAKATTA